MLNRSLLTSLLLILVLNLHAQPPQWIIAGDSVSAGITLNSSLRGIIVDNINRQSTNWKEFDIEGDSVTEIKIVCSVDYWQLPHWKLYLNLDYPSTLIAPGGNSFFAYHPGDTIFTSLTGLTSAYILDTYTNGVGAPQIDGWSPDSINYIGFRLEHNGGWRLGWLQVQVVDLGAPGGYNYFKGIIVGAAYRDLEVSATPIVCPDDCQIFPNPSSGIVQLSLPADRQSGRFTLHNMHGQLVFQGHYKLGGQSFDLSLLQPGMYIATCTDYKGQVLRSRLVLE